MQRRQQPAREQALRVQVEALRSALDITHDAWLAKTAIHEEARRLRRETRR